MTILKAASLLASLATSVTGQAFGAQLGVELQYQQNPDSYKIPAYCIEGILLRTKMHFERIDQTSLQHDIACLAKSIGGFQFLDWHSYAERPGV